eukprot:CAMPEP_0180516540 /NCGR_PEP_ID=MMETSP1036_2-20121128/53977_1 /TAXON_ID=632150 /ORGANISM="Azadinium spinosum, Strain 3D9" /LENGTH=62 /DNA_ID=CAMNT_0022528355 /DNA_START=14 /DNA_END=198 /DNA_ORIENTATION=+
MPMGRTRKVTKTPTRAARGMATATGRCCEKCLYFVCTLRSEKRGHVRPSLKRPAAGASGKAL